MDNLVNRFLCWKLPQTFAPDCGISFDGRKDDEWNKNKTWPVGTNLLTAIEARQMLEYVIGDELESLRAEVASLKEDADIKAKLMLDYTAKWEAEIARLEVEKAIWIRRADKTWHEDNFNKQVADLTQQLTAAKEQNAVLTLPVAYFEAQESTRGMPFEQVFFSMLYSTRWHKEKPQTTNPVWVIFARGEE